MSEEAQLTATRQRGLSDSNKFGGKRLQKGKVDVAGERGTYFISKGNSTQLAWKKGRHFWLV